MGRMVYACQGIGRGSAAFYVGLRVGFMHARTPKASCAAWEREATFHGCVLGFAREPACSTVLVDCCRPWPAAHLPASFCLDCVASHHPRCSFVCPTEIIAFSDRAKEFEALNCQVSLAYMHFWAQGARQVALCTAALRRCWPPQSTGCPSAWCPQCRGFTS